MSWRPGASACALGCCSDRTVSQLCIEHGAWHGCCCPLSGLLRTADPQHMRCRCFGLPPASQVFDPVVRWVQQEMGVSPEVSHSIFGADLLPEDVAAVRRYLLGKARGARLLLLLCCCGLELWGYGRRSIQSVELSFILLN